jgi:hypothetical protein
MREPLLLDPNGARPELNLLGISGGLFSAAVVPISTNFDTLYDACLEAGRVWSRLCDLTLVRSRAMEDRPGVWGWAVLGISAEELAKTLEQFQNAMVSKHTWISKPPSYNPNIGTPGPVDFMLTRGRAYRLPREPGLG